MDFIELITYGSIIPVFLAVRWLSRRKGHRSPIFPGLAVVGYVVGLFGGPAIYLLLVQGAADKFFDHPVPGRMFSATLYIVSLASALASSALVAVVALCFPSPRFHKPSPSLGKAIFFGTSGCLLVAAGFCALVTDLRLSYSGSLIGFGAIYAGGYCINLARRARTATAQERVNLDWRLPVLFLRSFSQDDEYAVRDWSRILLRPFLGGSMFISFEEFIAPAIHQHLGPVIALGNPNDYLPSIGAAKDYFDNDKWFHEFSGLAKRARCICVLEGVSRGLRWELEWLHDNAHPTKLFILTHVHSVGRRRVPHEGFWQTLQTIGFSLPDYGEPGIGSVVTFDEGWRAVTIRTNARSSWDYVEAIGTRLDAIGQ